MNPYENLANAIIVQAAKDYHRALRTLKYNPHSRQALDEIQEIEQFFKSEWFTLLTDMNGGVLLTKIRERTLRKEAV